MGQRGAAWGCDAVTERVRIDFLNWQPDQDELNNDGLITCTNVVHEPEGFKPVYLASAGAFSTETAFASVTSLVSETVGSNLDVVSGYIGGDVLRIALNGVAVSPLNSTQISFATTGSSQCVAAFDVAELNGQVAFVMLAQQETASPATTVNTYMSGLFTVTSVVS
jgi:hypothetical protein